MRENVDPLRASSAKKEECCSDFGDLGGHKRTPCIPEMSDNDKATPCPLLDSSEIDTVF